MTSTISQQEALHYIRAKVNQLLTVIGTCLLQPEALDDNSLIELDPIGIIAESFKQVIEQLNATNQRLHALLDAAQEVAIIATDADGRITVFNLGAEKMLGYNVEELQGRTPVTFHLDSEIHARAHELTAQLDRPISGFETLVAPIRAGGSDVRNWTFLRKDGLSLQVSMVVSAVLNQDGQVEGFLCIARDITQQLAAEAKLIQLNQDLDNRVRERTQALQASAEQLQQTLNHLHHTQNQLVQAEKLSGLGSIVAAVAHELNTPVGNCLTVASTLHDKTMAFEAQFASGKMLRSQFEDHLEMSRTATELLLRGLHRTVDLVSNFKQVAVDQSSAQRRRFDLNEVVTGVVALLNAGLRKTPYRIELAIPDGLVMESFPGAIEQIISNLVNNSVLHGFDGRNHGLIRMAAVAEGEHIRLTYNDDGYGMTAEVQHRVFDPFFTTRFGQGGSGLGMNICYNLTTGSLGGSVEVASEVGKGSTFTFLLPLVAQPALPA